MAAASLAALAAVASLAAASFAAISLATAFKIEVSIEAAKISNRESILVLQQIRLHPLI